MKAEPSTEDMLRKSLRYDGRTGKLYMLGRRGGLSGREAGRLIQGGYRQIRIGKRFLLAHRVIWFLEKGAWPKEIDHINGVRDDNRIENLREVTKSLNAANRKRPTTNTSGYKGVSWAKRYGKWLVQVKRDGVSHHVGYFSDLASAARAYAISARALFGENARIE